MKITLLLTAASLLLAGSLLHAAELTEAQKADLAAYGKVRAALVAMDLAGAKAAASTATVIPEDKAAVAELAASANIKDARKAFRKWSDTLIPIAKGQPGYFIAHCPMVKGTWVQTEEKITNPLAGDTMPACGVIVKDK
jgi:dihydrodipicolinate synthase/N-acetylneuraminate lyase